MTDRLDFVKISKYAGMREDLIQAGGGNTSVKISDHEMHIKASGVQLAEISDSQGFSVVDQELIKDWLHELLQDKNSRNEKEILEAALISGGKPSIETFLHAVTGKLTLHTHPVAANVLLCRKDGDIILKRLFPEALIVGYATPGLNLAKSYYQTLKDAQTSGDKKFSVIFLSNHGLIVSGETADEVIERNEHVIGTLESYLHIDHQSYHLATWLYQLFHKADNNNTDVIYKVGQKEILDYYKALDFKLWDFQFCPDCIVFCGLKPFEASSGTTEKEIIEFERKYGEIRIIECKKNLYIKADSVRRAKEIESVLAFSAQIARYNCHEEIQLLDEDEQRFLTDWDAEKYRRFIR